MGEQLGEISRLLRREWPWEEEGRPEDEVWWGRGFPYQVLGHGLGPDVDGEAAQLRGVLKFTIEGPQVHWKNVVFRKSWFLKKKKKRETDSSLACLKPQQKSEGLSYQQPSFLSVIRK